MTHLIHLRWLALAGLLLVLAALVPGVIRSSVPDNALSVWFLETDEALVQYHAFQDAFGNDEVALVLVEPAQGVLTEPGLEVLQTLSDRLTEVDGVQAVHSILTIQDAARTTDEEGRSTVTFRPAIEGGLEALQGNPLIVDRLVSEDGRSAMLWVEMVATEDFDARRDTIIGEVTETAGAVLGSQRHALGGVGVIYSGLNLATQHDFGLFVGLGYLFIFLAIGMVFRSWRMVLGTMGVVSFGVAASLGAYGWMGHQLNMVTVVLPTIVIVLGLADLMHFPAAFAAEQVARPEDSRAAQAAAALRRVFLPCLLTTVTTMAGFAALVSSPMAVIHHLGVYAAIGVGAALAASVVWMAIVLPSLPAGWRFPRSRLIHGLLEATKAALFERRAALAGLSLLLVGLAGLGAARVVADTYTIGYLPDDHRVVRDHHLIEETWGPYSVLDFVVQPSGDTAVDSPEILDATRRLAARATALDGIAAAYGLHDVHRRLADVLGIEVAPDEPLSPRLVARLNLLLEMEGFEWTAGTPGHDENVLRPWRTEDGSLGRMTMVGRMASAVELDRLLGEVQVLADEEMGDLGRIQPAGYPPLYTRIVDYAVSSQVRSFFLALGIIFTLMLVWLRSLRLALVALVPNAFPVFVMMGVMGALGIHLDIVTATVAAIVVGVSIDDTVHFMLHWREAERAGRSWEEAVEHTFAHAGVPAVLTTLLLVVGYPVLMLAEVGSVAAFGLLTTVAALAALFGDLILLPLVLRLAPGRIRT